MKYRIKKLKDRQPLKEEVAIEFAKNKLAGTDYFAAIYGEVANKNQEFFVPILVDEESLRNYEKEFLKRNPKGRLRVIYQSNLKDAPLYEVESKLGEAWIDIPDKEIDDFIKKRLVDISNNPRLFTKYRNELIDMLEDELQSYANTEFYEKGRGEIYTDSLGKKKIKGYILTDLPAIRNYAPAEKEVGVVSDFSDDMISSEDHETFWLSDEDKVGTLEEVEEDFLKRYVSDVKEDEYEEAKKVILIEGMGTEKDFENHPELVKVGELYDFKDKLKDHLKQWLEDYSYSEVNWDSYLIDYTKDGE